MKQLTILILLFVFTTSFAKHPINLSNSIIMVKGNSATLTTKLCYLDFFYAVKELTGKDLVLKDKNFAPASMPIIQQYWDVVFKIWINNKPLKVTLKKAVIYNQEDGATAEFEFEIPHFKASGQTLKMHNEILVKTVTVQKNIVHFYLEKGNKLLTVMMFSKDETDKTTKL